VYKQDSSKQKIDFLCAVAQKEQKHLLYSKDQLFLQPFTVEKAKTLLEDEPYAATLEAFTSRFCRFQDTLGDKLFPAWLELVGEKQKTFLDDLHRLEKLQIIESSEQWLQARSLRNKMIHEYIDSPVLLTSAVNEANDFISQLHYALNKVLDDLKERT